MNPLRKSKIVASSGDNQFTKQSPLPELQKFTFAALHWVTPVTVWKRPPPHHMLAILYQCVSLSIRQNICQKERPPVPALHVREDQIRWAEESWGEVIITPCLVLENKTYTAVFISPYDKIYILENFTWILAGVLLRKLEVQWNGRNLTETNVFVKENQIHHGCDLQR